MDAYWGCFLFFTVHLADSRQRAYERVERLQFWLSRDFALSCQPHCNFCLFVSSFSWTLLLGSFVSAPDGQVLQSPLSLKILPLIKFWVNCLFALLLQLYDEFEVKKSEIWLTVDFLFERKKGNPSSSLYSRAQSGNCLHFWRIFLFYSRHSFSYISTLKMSFLHLLALNFLILKTSISL